MARRKTDPPRESVFVTSSSGREASSPADLRLVHYNDVYHLDPSSAEPAGGAARFLTAINHYRRDSRYAGQPELLTLFSGDVFNPSLESSITKGSHMVPILNAIGTDCAAVGNHDLDFGVRQFEYLAAKCKFPWLLANVFDPALGEGVPIGHAKRTHMLTCSNGIKVGLLGLGEREWLETVNAIPPNIIYKSATEVAKELVAELREQGADIIIALTHQREPNDNKLAENMGGEIDIILGGHDHFYAHSFINGTHVLRSGSDFKQLSYIEVRRRPDDGGGRAGPRWDFDIWRKDIISSIPQDQPTVELIDKLTAKLKQSLEKPVGWTAAPLDARFTTVRLRESNIGNFVCDIMRHHYQADCVIMASGTIRGDQIYAPGPIRVKDITDCFPFEDPVVVIRVNGQAIWDALENGVSLYPAQEGRFPQVSNIRFEFDPSKESGSRINRVEVANKPLDPKKRYVLCTRGYMARAKDGYKSLLVQSEGGEAEEIVSEENGILISMMLRQYFMALKVLEKWHNWEPSWDSHWDKVVTGVGSHHPNYPVSPSASTRKGWLDGGVEPADPRPAAARPDSRGSHWDHWRPANIRARRSSVTPFDEKVVEGARPVHESDGERLRRIDHELRVMRRTFARWTRKAGVRAEVCDSLGEGECEVEWTKAICPRLEGRIVMVGGEEEKGRRARKEKSGGGT
ncbi:uncharacterized protein E0L32_011363 [Thyridium curvatum]|uniref:5'-nucleotidase n=1 Tax=Thyridium curvatum TaxID=1093900 RepID=A0A507BQ88_9PEZI|nr:uncharacterized protein E0L32_011363 [Thyridium curvatum]TPX18970.1 hypothetical protein E0L32_011363 [Thyridium curvatum]